MKSSVSTVHVFCVEASCERAGDGELLTGGFSSSDSDDDDDDYDIQLDDTDTAGAHNERRDVARSPTTTRTSLKLKVVTSATCRMSTELLCFIVVFVVAGMLSSPLSSSRTCLQFVFSSVTLLNQLCRPFGYYT